MVWFDCVNCGDCLCLFVCLVCCLSVCGYAAFGFAFRFGCLIILFAAVDVCLLLICITFELILYAGFFRFGFVSVLIVVILGIGAFCCFGGFG